MENHVVKSRLWDFFNSLPGTPSLIEFISVMRKFMTYKREMLSSELYTIDLCVAEEQYGAVLEVGKGASGFGAKLVIDRCEKVFWAERSVERLVAVFGR